MKSKSRDLAKWLAQRIRQGDYDLHGFPSGLSLSTELGISQNTAYKVVDILVEEGLLTRKDTGRVEIQKASNRPDHPRRVAFLVPAFASAHFDMVAGIWRQGLDSAAGSRQVQIRPLVYTDYDDPVIREAVSAFEGVFFYSMAAPVPEQLVDLFQSRLRQVVALGVDLSKHGLRSVRLASSRFLQQLLDHLAALGHRRVDCLNVHPVTAPDVEKRIEAWEIWKRAHGLTGCLINDPVPSSGVPFDEAFARARGIMERLLAAGQFDATALFCVSLPAALGAMRALDAAGLEVGHDVSVCAASDEGICRYLTPSLTTLGVPDPSPFLDLCLDRIFSPEEGWEGPLLLEPERIDLLIGDTTGPCPEAQPRKKVARVSSRLQ